MIKDWRWDITEVAFHSNEPFSAPLQNSNFSVMCPGSLSNWWAQISESNSTDNYCFHILNEEVMQAVSPNSNWLVYNSIFSVNMVAKAAVFHSFLLDSPDYKSGCKRQELSPFSVLLKLSSLLQKCCSWAVTIF